MRSLSRCVSNEGPESVHCRLLAFRNLGQVSHRSIHLHLYRWWRLAESAPRHGNNLVDENDHHLENDNRFYLFVSPSPMDGKQDLDLHEANADMIAVGKRLVDVYTGQATFRDWIQAETINDQIDILDKRAAGLALALERDEINPAILTAASQQILALMYATEAGARARKRP